MEEWEDKKLERAPKKSSKKKSKKTTQKPKATRSSNPPVKSESLEAWSNWYKEEIKERISKGETIPSIAKELRIREESVKAFIS